ncbi:SRPBCC domain-containing protein [Streptomyces subrutilus]|uniref:Carbon monoxide dehydrogenase n=1 Tax=Streptomyces subrutilus TaxID=36818 RepID=A0A1E5PSW8_9ACTN|nr:SRPBCC domain-containing protein [Streptomyces subrutilus]OEJ32646.1 hypothetical protein BGK67_16080 [Streptomyces subrutilus]
MEHQTFVPVPADRLRAVLRDPVRTARCVPGLQQDADTESGPLSGRLKVRVGGHTVTYRGAFSVTERDPGHFAVDGEGTEVRGSGTVKLTLALRLTPEGDDRTRLDFTAGATADGRAAGFPAEATATVVRRLLDQTAERLAEAADGGAAGAGSGGSAGSGAAAGAAGSGEAAGSAGSGEAAGSAEPAGAAESAGPAESTGPAGSPGPAESTGPAESAGAAAPEVSDPVADAEEDEAGGADGSEDDDITEVTASVFETDVPPPSLDPFLADGLDDLGDLPRPPAEAAHARRTMIGRSAEEVDHAPPRGRYAPVPAPANTSAGDSLRWLAPAAALAVASAIAIGRALRRRR